MKDDQTLRDDISLILQALAFAARKHSEQRRKGAKASPYINHPIALANVLCNEGGITDVRVICAALLHDTVEDTQTTPQELEEHFGVEIRHIVAEVSDDKSLPKDERKHRQVQHAPNSSHEAKLVKLADKICNLRDLADDPPVKWDLERRKGYFDWAKEVVDQIRGTHPKLEALFDAAFAKRPE
jgi:GTP diphosphokinase / guanosine-3',5'-bis(diphosphate) 3'-diphosphatase